jgi:pimeloyl-ACP methyl ester carboxylesterase
VDVKWLDEPPYTIRYLVGGPVEGPQVLLLHGLVMMAHYFEPLMRDLVKQGYRVYAPELPGTGYSSRLPYPLKVEQMAEIYAWWAAKLKLDGPFHIIGHSAGAQVAVELELQYPHLVKSLSLLSATGGKSIRGWFREFLGILSDVTIEKLFLIGHASASYLKAGLPESVAAARAHVDYEIREKFNLLRHVPTLILWGTRDIIAPQSFAYELSQNIPGSRLRIIEGASHGLVVGWHHEVAAYFQEFERDIEAGKFDLLTKSLDIRVKLELEGLSPSSNNLKSVNPASEVRFARRLVRRLIPATPLAKSFSTIWQPNMTPAGKALKGRKNKNP